jgi:hypothetical protein
MIKRLLEGFDLAGTPLLFYVGARIFACCALLETGRARLSKSGKGLRRDRQFAHTLLIGENSSVSCLLRRLRGYAA